VARKSFAVSSLSFRRSHLYFFLCALFLALACSLVTRAQTPTGSIAGTVVDNSGAVIPSAKITLTQLSGGQIFSTTADADGNYDFAALEPGDYVVQVEAPNFKTAKLQLHVSVGQAATGNVTLQVGEVQQTVNVSSSEETQIDVNRNTIEGTVTETQMASLPTDGRNFLDLASLEPGVQVVDAAALEMTKTGFTAVSIAGSEGRTTRIQVDGIDITDEVVGASTQNFSMDGIGGYQISEFSLDSSTSLSNTGAINLYTRSGANQLHGSTYLYWRDHNFASRIAGLDAPFHRLQGGFRVGGPALKDKVFWFLNFEDTGQDTGTFLEPVAPFNVPQFEGAVITPFRERLGTGRADWNISSRVHAFYRFSHDDNYATTGFGGNILSPVLNKNNTNASVVGADLTYSKITHSFRYGHINFADYLDPTQPAGIPVFPMQIIFDDTGTTFGPNFLANQHSLQTNDQVRYDGTFEFRDHVIQYGMNFTRVAANLFGAVFSSAPEVDTFTSVLGVPDPNPMDYLPSRDIIFGNGLGFFSSKPSEGFPFGGIFNNRLAWYVADSIRPARDITLNAGLRWEVDPGQVNNDLVRPAILDTLQPGQSGREPIDKDNFAPTVGLAWNVAGHGTTVIRGGAGIYYETNIFENVLFDRVNFLPTSIAPQFPTVFPGNNFVIGSDGNPVNCPTGPAFNYSTIASQPLSATAGEITCEEQALQTEAKAFSANFPAGNPSFEPCNPVTPTCPQLPMTVSIGSMLNRNFTQPYSIQTNIGVQHKFGNNILVQADFVRNRGVHIYLVQDMNDVGAARNLNVPGAMAAISAANSQFGCGTGTDAASINCAIANGASIGAYSGFGLGVCSTSPIDPSIPCAFPGTNPAFGVMNMIGTQGLSLYKGLLLKITGRTDHFTRFINHATWGLSYALSRFDATQFDQANSLNSLAFNNDCPTCLFGPVAGDRTDQLSAYSMVHLPWGFNWNTITHLGSPYPVTLRLAEFTGGSPAEVFFTDINGDGKGDDVLPGTNLGAFGRTISGVSALNNAISNFNAKYAGQFTPASQALLQAGLFTATQLQQLGALIQPIASAQPDQVTTTWFWTTDFRFGKTFGIKDRVQVEPAVDVFNVFNRVNFDPIGNVLGGTLFAQTEMGLPLCTDASPQPCLSGSVNSTPTKFRTNEYGLGAGSFSPGIPRSLQFLVRVDF
jgi:hypothetical protein